MLARLRNRRFFSLHELNAAIREIVADLNAKIMRKLGVSRNELFAEIDRSALKALPTAPYQYAEWKKCWVAPDYHVEIADHITPCRHAPSASNSNHVSIDRRFGFIRRWAATDAAAYEGCRLRQALLDRQEQYGERVWADNGLELPKATHSTSYPIPIRLKSIAGLRRISDPAKHNSLIEPSRFGSTTAYRWAAEAK